MEIEEMRKLWDKKNGGRAANSEHDLQVSCVNVFRLLYPAFSYLLMAIPNGGYRSKTTARIMKAEGQMPGVPDMFLAIPFGGYHGLWIEMKNGKAGRLSEHQHDMIARLRNQGYRVEVCRTLDEFLDTVRSYLGK